MRRFALTHPKSIIISAIMPILLLTVTVGSAMAQTDPQNPAGTGPTSPLGPETPFDPNQKIKPGFDVNVTVTNAKNEIETDLTGVFRVDTRGMINEKLVGEIDIKDLKPAQAADLIAGKLKAVVINPTVKVSIASVPRPQVLLSGQVTKPGSYPINSGTTLGEALTIFGVTENADLARVRITHKTDAGEKSTQEYNFLKWLKPNGSEKPDEAQNPVLQDKDLVFLQPKAVSAMGVVKVEGSVIRPGIVPIETGLPTDLRQALARAGGPTPTADKRQVTLRRYGVEKPFIFDYDKVEAGDAMQNILIREDDIIYVSSLGPDQFINLNGAFIRPGKLPYNRPITLTQAVSEGAGLSPQAKGNEGKVFRHIGGADPTKTQIISFNYDKVRKNLSPDFLLEPGDTVEVPIGSGPRPQLTGLELAQSLLSVALIVDRLLNPGTRQF
ncbi:MAG: SLBB domain-containing protein [Chthonomonadales bacterium]